MKKPRISFSKDAILSFLIGHGEKIIAAAFGLFACTLAWGGIEALRNMRPTQEQKPEWIVEKSQATDTHIDVVKIAPDAELTSEKGLSAIVDPWLRDKVSLTARPLLFNKPLFAELAKRGSPDILPLEDLRAEAGVVVLAAKPAPAGGRQAAADRPTELDANAPGKGGKPGRGGAKGPPQPVMAPAPPPADMGGIPGMADQPVGQPKLVPFVLVTGLIPIKKQLEEYDQRFHAASLHDMNIDTPRWNSYRIERAEIIPGAAEKWVPIDMKSLARQYSAEWLRLQSEPMLAPMMLPPDLEPRDKTAAPIPFCSPLPQLVDGTWGFKGLHPWFVDRLIRDDKERQEKEKAARETVPDDVFNAAGQTPGSGGPMMTSEPSPTGMMPANGEMGMGAGVPRHSIDGMEYRLFRFVDLSVAPGRSYRYRVRLVCWNPNLNLPTRHLADVSLAKKPTLESPMSEATQPTLVPDGKTLLVQPLKKQDLKRLKSGLIPIMALGEKPRAGILSLRGLIMELGGLANVDAKADRKGDPRSLGDDLATERVLIDVRGERQERGEMQASSGKPTPPPEPLEMIFLRPDGSFEYVCAADSQLQIERYRPTAPPELGGGPPAGAAAAGPAAPPSPFGNPFNPPAPGATR